MDIAKKLSPVPDPEPSKSATGYADGVDFHAQSHAERTGGDLFDNLQIGPRVAFLLTDIAGRRPELDPVASEMQRVFRTTSTELFTPASVNLMEAAETLILAINHALFGISKGVRFAPTFVGCYDLELGVLAYVNAGGQTAILRDSDGTRALPNISMPLGLFTHLTYDASIQAFEPGAMLLVVTKGVSDGMGSNSLTAQEALIDLMQTSNYKSASVLCTAVLDAAANSSEKHHWDWLPFKAKALSEDMTALVMLRTA